jgi:hypothetical protein
VWGGVGVPTCLPVSVHVSTTRSSILQMEHDERHVHLDSTLHDSVNALLPLLCDTAPKGSYICVCVRERERDHLCGLAVRVPGYGTRGPGFDSQRYQILFTISEFATGSTQPRVDNRGAT